MERRSEGGRPTDGQQRTAYGRAAGVNRVRSTAERVLGARAPPVLGPEQRRHAAAVLATHRGEVLHAWWTAQFDPRRLRRFGVPVAELPPARALVRGFLVPLFELLRAWIRTGEARYADVYLDERLRYAPHQAAWVLRTQFFDEILPEEEGAVLASFADEEARAAIRSLLRDLHAPLRAAAPLRPVRLLAMGDCLMNELRVSLLSRCRADGIPLDFRGIYFSALYGSGLSADPALALLREFPADLVALSFLSYRGIAPFAALMREAGRLPAREIPRRVDAIVATIRDFLALLRAHTDAPFVVHNVSGLPLTPLRRMVPFLPPVSAAHRDVLCAMNERIAALVAATPDTLLLDEAETAARHGARACMERLVPPWIAAGGDFHTARFGEYLAPGYVDVLRSYRDLARCKVLAVDFDNTLWDGVMAEGPVEQRPDLQRLLRRLKDAGILLVAVSKNDPRNVRWAEMVLQPGDFVLQKVGWNPKAQSIQEAAQQLSLGLDSFVLLDDNPAERDLVRSRLPQVTTLDPNAAHARRWLERMLAFPNTRQTEEARHRTELYRQQAERAAVLAAPVDYPEMMASLQLRARCGLARERDLDRIVELVQRTNQFNTTTVRHGRQQLAALLRDPAHGLYAATLGDKFGSLGLVAVALVRRAGDDRILEAFVMSCRAMGFGLEQLVLRTVLDAEGGPGIRFVGRYVPSERNAPCSTLYPSSGFVRVGATEWLLSPDAARPPVPPWFDPGGAGERAA